MTSYKAPIRDYQFLLKEFLQADKTLLTLPGFENLDADTIEMVLEEGAKICEEVLHPINHSGDQEGCQFKDGGVSTPKGFKKAYELYTESGWSSLSLSQEYGGQGLPETLNFMIEEMTCSANTSFSLYSVLTRGAVNVIQTYASEPLKQTYLEKMVSGVWSGTMCLTEPHAGTDLGMVKTKAIPLDEGGYKISGTKIFITGGEHDLTENIIHLVLARLPDAPEGVKGISLFLVPKYLPLAVGGLASERNVSCGSIEHKMGIKASSTCVMNFDQAQGFLVGEENQGLPHMFKLMNLARLAIGLQGLALSEVAYQNAALYARERLQTRSLSGVKNPDSPADPIIVHADVRRMLLTTRAFTQGARALSLWIALQIDISHRHPDKEQSRIANDMVELMTPVIKAFFTDIGYECTTVCQQVFGGHGYIQETGMEQFVRDARIAQIYEGTNGIQALDLVRRKLFLHDGRLPEQFFDLVEAFIGEHQTVEQTEFIVPLSKALDRLRELTSWLITVAHEDPDELGAASTDYLRVFALVTLAWLWAKMALLASTSKPDNFEHAKITTARFFFGRLLPQIEGLDTAMRSGASRMMTMREENF